MKKLSGWQKVGLFAGVGCFSVIAIVVVGFAIAVAYARSTLAKLGDTTPTRVERAIPLPATPTTSVAEAPDPSIEAGTAKPGASKPGDDKTNGGPLKLALDLQEGTFIIKPGAAGSRVQVDGQFSEALYELTERTDTESGSPRTTIRFRSKAPMWARMLAGVGNDDGSRPRLTVSVPTGVPMDLSLNVTMGESRIDLGGLTLSNLGLDLSMGNHEVDFKEPVVDGMVRLRLNAQMGNVSVDNLGNARAKSIETSGSMGNVTADLGGAWPQGSEAQITFTQSMGEVRVNVPTKVKLEADVRDSEGKTRTLPADADETTDPKAPLLKVRVSTSMGEGRVHRY
jgi:hypothetical protein